MVSRETRAIGTALLTLLVVLGILGALEAVSGLPTGWSNLLGFLLVAGLGFAVPQLYLARTDPSVSPPVRIRTIPIVFILFGTMFSRGATTPELLGIWAVVAGAILLALVYEFRAGYFSSTGFPNTESTE